MPSPNPVSPATAVAPIGADKGVRVLPVHGLPEIREGTDLIPGLADACAALPGGIRDGDVLCVSTKIISKARGLRIAPEDKEAAIDRASLREVVRREHEGTITRVVVTRSGPVLAAAGIDASNSPGGLLLLPEDPDAEANDLRRGLEKRLRVRLGVILTDTSSRIWRMGVGDIALGSAGVRGLQDLRGTRDTAGREMGVTVRNLADEIAAAADLVKGKTEGVPAAVVRGVQDALSDDAPGARALNRAGEDDWFRLPSLESAWTALGLEQSEQPVAAMAPEEPAVRIARAIRVASHVTGDDSCREIGNTPGGSPATPARRALIHADAQQLAVVPSGADPEAWADAGALAERLRAALRAEALAAPLPHPPVRILVDPQNEPMPRRDATTEEER